MNEPQKMSRRDWFRLKVTPSGTMLSNEKTLRENPGAENRIVENHSVESQSEQNKSSSAESNEPQDALKPIEHPPNHDGMDLSQLPPMREAVLDHAQLQSLFSDVGQLATDVTLMQRNKSARSSASNIVEAKETAEQLQVAHRLLVEGQISRLQIRYRWQDSLWIDTLDRRTEGFRLVRIFHQGT